MMHIWVVFCIIWLGVKATSELDGLKLKVAELADGLTRVSQENLKLNEKVASLEGENEKLFKLSQDHGDVLKLLSRKGKNIQ